MYIYIYIYIYTHVCIYIYIYIYLFTYLYYHAARNHTCTAWRDTERHCTASQGMMRFDAIQIDETLRRNAAKCYICNNTLYYSILYHIILYHVILYHVILH